MFNTIYNKINKKILSYKLIPQFESGRVKVTRGFQFDTSSLTKDQATGVVPVLTQCTLSSAGSEHLVYTERVGGSNPSGCTMDP